MYLFYRRFRFPLKYALRVEPIKYVDMCISTTLVTNSFEWILAMCTQQRRHGSMDPFSSCSNWHFHRESSIILCRNHHYGRCVFFFQVKWCSTNVLQYLYQQLFQHCLILTYDTFKMSLSGGRDRGVERDFPDWFESSLSLVLERTRLSLSTNGITSSSSFSVRAETDLAMEKNHIKLMDTYVTLS